MSSHGLPDREQVAELIGTIYDAALNGGLWAAFLRSLVNAFDARSALLLHVEKQPCRREYLETVELDVGIMAKWSESRDHTDVWWGPIHGVGVSRSVVYSKLVSPKITRKSGFYADVCLPNSVDHGLAGVADLEPQRETFLAVYRARHEQDFSQDQRMVHELFLPHIRRAFAVSRRLALAELGTTALPEALRRLPFGALVLDQSGYSLSISDKADAIFLENDGITLRSGRLRFWDYLEQRQFDRLVEAPGASAVLTTGEPGGLVRGSRPSGRQDYRVLVCPLNSRSEWLCVAPRATWLVFIHDPEETRAIAPEILIRLYELTKSEARLCAELFRTGSLELAISNTGVSRNTAKTHLKRIFEKTGTASQAQLLQKLALGLATVA